ncbi:hypothetical protein F4819DRAFT_459730 [Hypoxylon fuscum]|nr:hypothetical protein F4819DRAFT_459730 [Hypoxylon fuscum]
MPILQGGLHTGNPLLLLESNTSIVNAIGRLIGLILRCYCSVYCILYCCLYAVFLLPLGNLYLPLLFIHVSICRKDSLWFY